MAGNGFTFGAYLGYPTSTAYQTNLTALTSLVGQSPAAIDTFVDWAKPMSAWVQNSQSSAARLASSMGTSVLPVLALPLGSSVSDGLTALQRFNAIASGAYDSIWTGIIQAYQAQGFTSLDLRIGWEMNGGWYSWAVKSSADAQGYVAAFQHIANLVRGMSGISVKTVWNPAIIGNEAFDTESSYPGDKYVDIVGADLYARLYPLNYYDWSKKTVDSTFAQWYSNPVNMEHYWDYPDANQYFPTGKGTGWGMVEALNFAKAHGKAFALPEAGLTDRTVTTSGPADNPTFPKYLADRLLTAAAGGQQIALFNLWDSGNYVITDGSRPNSAAAWADFVARMEAGFSQIAPVTANSYGTLTKGDGNYAVTGGAAVNRAAITLGNGNSTVTLTGWADKVTLGDGNQAVTLNGSSMTVVTGDGDQAIVVTGGWGTTTIGNTPSGSTSTIQFNSQSNVVRAGNGDVTVNGAGATGYSTVTLGNGADTVTVGGSNNNITVGAGAGTITVGGSGAYGSKVVAAGAAASGGSVTVNVTGKSDKIDVGAGNAFINSSAGGSGDTFAVNGSGQGLTTITGFSIGGDMLDLTRTLAGTGIGTDVTQIGTYVTATSANGGADTLLSVDPTGGSGKPYGFVLLKGVAASGTMISDMLARSDFVLH